MQSSEIEYVNRHKIITIIFRIRETSSGGVVDWPKERLKTLIEKRLMADMAAVKRVDESQSYHLYVFMRHKNNHDLISRLEDIFTPIDWKANNHFVIDVDPEIHKLSTLSRKTYMKSVSQTRIPSKKLFVRAGELVTFCEKNKSADAVKINNLKNSVLEIASSICEDHIQLHVFGSRLTGLAERESDVDIYIQRGISDEEQREVAEKFHSKIIQEPDVYSNLYLSTSTYVAFIKFKHNPSNLECNVSFRSGMSTTNSQLVKTYLEMDPRVKYVVCGVKIWMKMSELKIGFLTIAQVWLALFFLMQKGIVPSVEELRKTMPKDKQIRIIDGWNCAFPDIDNVQWSSSCSLSQEELLREFFIFYGENGLSLQDYVLCPSNGQKLNKVAFLDECKKKYSDEEFLRIIRDFRGPMGIQDPFVHHKTLTRFNKYWEKTFIEFVEYCKGTAEIYPSIPNVTLRTRHRVQVN